MVVMSSEVTKEIKHMAETLVRKGLYKSQSEVVRDAIRQLALKYGLRETERGSITKRVASASRKSGKTLSQTVREIRDEEQ